MLNKKIVTSRAIGILAFLLLWCALYSQVKDPVVIVDTLQENHSLSGNIYYNYDYYYDYHCLTNTVPEIGEGPHTYYGGHFYARYFITYPTEQIPEGYSINSAVIRMNLGIYLGDNEEGVWPQFFGVEYPIVLDHYLYTFPLSPEDFDNQVLTANIGSIVEVGNYELGWRSLDVTQYYLTDLQENRQYSQYRVRFPVDYDTDGLYDDVMFYSGQIYLIIAYSSDTETEDDCNELVVPISIYPNPAKDKMNISLSLKSHNEAKVSLFDIKGQQVYQAIMPNNVTSYEIPTANLPSGTYLIKMSTNGKTYSKKCLILH